MSTPINATPDPTSGPVPQQQPNTSPSDAEIRALAMQLVAMSSTPPALVLNQATIVSVDPTATPPTASITISGSSTQVNDVRFMSGYMPVPGDTVSVLKQNGSVLILGHTVDIGTTTASSGGWASPTLSSGFTQNGNSNGNLQYRLVTDNGVFKMQWQGSVAHSGSNTTIVSSGNALPAQFRPSARRSMLVGRNPAGGSNVAIVDFDTDGTMTLQGATAAPSGGGTTTEDSNNHNHAMGTSDTQLSGYLSQAGSDLGHAHGLGTSFIESTTHHHTAPAPTVSNPTFVVFNGVEYFL